MSDQTVVIFASNLSASIIIVIISIVITSRLPVTAAETRKWPGHRMVRLVGQPAASTASLAASVDVILGSARQSMRRSRGSDELGTSSLKAAIDDVDGVATVNWPRDSNDDDVADRWQSGARASLNWHNESSGSQPCPSTFRAASLQLPGDPLDSRRIVSGPAVISRRRTASRRTNLSSAPADALLVIFSTATNRRVYYISHFLSQVDVAGSMRTGVRPERRGVREEEGGLVVVWTRLRPRRWCHWHATSSHYHV